jgi:hypothetical protein
MIYIFMFCVLLHTFLLCKCYRNSSLSVTHYKCRIIAIDGHIYITLMQCAHQTCMVQVYQKMVNVECSRFFSNLCSSTCNLLASDRSFVRFVMHWHANWFTQICAEQNARNIVTRTVNSVFQVAPDINIHPEGLYTDWRLYDFLHSIQTEYV